MEELFETPPPPEKAEFLAWLAGFKGTEILRFVIESHTFAPEELERMRSYYSRHLVPKEIR